VPHCYLLCVTTGSAIDRQSNNVSLFSLVEQINLPPNSPPPPRGLLPVEIHAYFQLADSQVNRDFELRFALRAETGLETLSDVFRHRITASRFRVRTLGLPYPPVMGQYSLQVDVRVLGEHAAATAGAGFSSSPLSSAFSATGALSAGGGLSAGSSFATSASSALRDGPPWQRQAAAWPIALYQLEPRPRVTH
jgi:hypothetical protein